MEHVLNSPIRNHAFWKFLLFFCITVVIIVTAVFFDYDIPNKENQVLRAQVAHYQQDSGAQQEFIANMQDIKNLIDSMGKQDVDNGLLITKINDKLVKSNELQMQNKEVNGELNRLLLNVLLSYKNIKNQSLRLQEADQQIQQLTTQLKTCSDNNKLYMQQLGFNRGAN
jgi:hypothetical protein